jgi:hypothetical protein
MVLVLLLPGCGNSPYPPGAAEANTLYTAFTEHSPHHLDPTASYWSNKCPFTEHVVGMQDYAEQVRREDARLLQGHPPGTADRPFLNFRRWPLAGVSAPSRHRLRIRLKGRLPQWDHWMATTFLAPVPHYRGVSYPCEGTDEDRAAGRLADCGWVTPFIDRIEFRMEPERLAVRSKFLQAYLDVPLLDRDELGAALEGGRIVACQPVAAFSRARAG